MERREGPRLGRRALLGRAGRLALGAGLLGGGLGLYAHEIEPGWLDLERLRLPLPRLDPAFDGYRIAQLSDLHLDECPEPERLLAAAADLVNRQRPDLIVLTGDYVTRQAYEIANALVAGLRRLQAPDGVLAVLGNHDHGEAHGLIVELLRAARVVELRNDARTLARGQARLHLAGVDSVWSGAARLERALARIPADGAAILLAHEPDFADEAAASGRFDLQLSGHSHGGQVILPLLGPALLPPLAQKYPLGLYRVGELWQYTNRGLAATGFYSPLLGRLRPQLRLNCRPEVTLLTLTAAPAPIGWSRGQAAV